MFIVKNFFVIGFVRFVIKDIDIVWEVLKESVELRLYVFIVIFEIYM